jgi:putative peptidoglycan lipid II flippase
MLQRWIRRLQSAHPDHHAIARAMVRVALFVLLGSVARVAKEMAIAYRYGVSAEVDAYLFVFNIVTWPVGVWFSVLTVVLVPLAARIQHDAATTMPRFRAELLGLTLILGLMLAAIGWLGLPVLLQSSMVGLPSATAVVASGMANSMALLAPLGVLVGLFSAWMLAAGRHANTLLESVPALAIFAALLLVFDGGIAPLVWGTLAGYALHVGALVFLLAQRGEVERPRLTRRSPEWSPFWQGFGIMLAGQVLMTFTVLVDQFFAAHLGTGAIATLSYANRVIALILGVGAMAVSRATLPVFSKARAEGGTQIHGVAIHWVRLLFVLGLVAVAVAWWLAPLAVRLLFERGAFTADDTATVVDVLRYALSQLPFYFAGLVFVTFLSSRGAYGWLLWSGIIGLCVKLVGNTILIPVFGVGGIGLATALMYAFNFAFFAWVFRLTRRSA